MPRKKKTRRNSSKHPALKPRLNLKSRHDLIDYDYVNKLSPEEKEWLNQFTEEYVNGTLDRKDLDNNLHNTEELKKDCDDRNNARNRCLLTRNKASNTLDDLIDIGENEIVFDLQEDLIIEKLDNLEKIKHLKNSKKNRKSSNKP